MNNESLIRGIESLQVQGFRSSSVPQFLLDPQGKILSLSKGAQVLLGQPPEELKGQPLSRFVPGCPDFSAMPTGVGANLLPAELEIVSSGGDLVPVEVHCNSFELEPGQKFFLLVVHDISKNRFLDQQRGARLAKLSLLNQVSGALYGAQLTLDQVLEAVLICVTAGQGLGFNRAFLLLIDQQQQTLQGEIAIGPSNPEEASRIWQDLAGQQADLYEMITSYDSSRQQTDVVVNEIVKSMKVDLAKEDHLLIGAMRKRQAFRVLPGDVTEGSEQVYRWLHTGAFAVAPLVTRRGPLGVILADNAITKGEITDLDLEIIQLFANVGANAIENSRLYHELERRLVELRKVYQQHKQDQDTLLRMERLSVMGETSAIVAHELRNPLVAIGGFARTLLRSLDTEDPNHRYAAIITEEVVRLERIIHDLLDFVRPQKVMRKMVGADDLVGETVRRYEGKMGEQSLKLVLDLHAPNVKINVHPGEIQQVVQNLVMNSMQVLEPGGTVTVRTARLEGGLQVEVIDDGPGFSVEQGEEMFAPFFTTKPSGSGLGLTICSQIIKAHGGVLNARPGEDGGAVFSFILPLPKPQSLAGR